MNDPDDVPGAMTPAPPPLDDATVERLLRRAGVDGAADPPEDLESVAFFLSAVAELGDIPVQPRGSLVDLLAGGFEPTPLAAPVVVRSRFARLRGPVARIAGLSLVAQVLTGTGVAVASMTAAAGAGVLPASLQEPVGEVLNVVTPFRFPTAPATSTEEPTGTVAPAGTAEPSPVTDDASAGTSATDEPAPAVEETTATTATTEPAPVASGTTTTTTTPSPTPSATTSPTPAATESATPSTTPSPTDTATPDDTAGPTPTDEASPTASSRPTRQNERPDKEESTSQPTTEPTVEPTTDSTQTAAG